MFPATLSPRHAVPVRRLRAGGDCRRNRVGLSVPLPDAAGEQSARQLAALAPAAACAGRRAATRGSARAGRVAAGAARFPARTPPAPSLSATSATPSSSPSTRPPLSADALQRAGKIGSDLLIRGWFKWQQRLPVSRWADVPPQVHRQGALFGGGITCSALYDGENGITRGQLEDMATRGAGGRTSRRLGHARHPARSLSSPVYRDYLFGWCRQQIDAGVDYLFLDEHTAALADVRATTTTRWPISAATWPTSCPADPGLDATTIRAGPASTAIASGRSPHLSGRHAWQSFNYRAWLQQQELVADPHASREPARPRCGTRSASGGTTGPGRNSPTASGSTPGRAEPHGPDQRQRDCPRRRSAGAGRVGPVADLRRARRSGAEPVAGLAVAGAAGPDARRAGRVPGGTVSRLGLRRSTLSLVGGPAFRARTVDADAGRGDLRGRGLLRIPRPGSVRLRCRAGRRRWR